MRSYLLPEELLWSLSLNVTGLISVRSSFASCECPSDILSQRLNFDHNYFSVFSQAQMWSSILHVHLTICIPLHCTCEQYRACYPCENCRFAHRGWQSSCIILQYFCINAVSLFGFIGWEEIFPIGTSQQGNKLQQSFQSSTKYWRHQPTSGQNKTRERRGTAKQFSCHELVTARSYP